MNLVTNQTGKTTARTERRIDQVISHGVLLAVCCLLSYKVITGLVITAGITTAVVMVVAAISPQQAWRQPILRVIDTIVGIAVGVTGAWIGLKLAPRIRNQESAGVGQIHEKSIR